MSDLYSVEIERLRGGEVTLRVTTVHPDAGPPPEEPTFAVNLLCDLWNLLDDGSASLIEGCALGEARGKALARAPAYAGRMAELRALGFGRNEPCTAEDVKRFQQQMNAGEPMMLRGMRISGWGSIGTQEHVFINGDPKAFEAEVAKMTKKFVVDEYENEEVYEKWPRTRRGDWRARMPRVRMRLTLKEPALLGFVRTGWRFDSASYE